MQDSARVGHDYDQLAMVVSEVFKRGRRRVGQMQHQVRTTVSVDRNGRPYLVSFGCDVPSGCGGEREFTFVSLPWEVLGDSKEAQLSELSITISDEGGLVNEEGGGVTLCANSVHPECVVCPVASPNGVRRKGVGRKCRALLFAVFLMIFLII